MDIETATLITLGWELHEQGISTTRIAKQVGKHREMVGLWLSSIESAWDCSLS